MSRTLLVINPTSGGGKGKKIGNQVSKILKMRGIAFEEILEQSQLETVEVLRSSIALGNLEKVILVGGDGLVHLAIQVLAKSDIPVIVIPAGTGNDFVRAQNFPLDNPIEILDYSYSCKPKSVDLGMVSSQYFADILSTGFDSIVNERANRIHLIRGPMKYNVAIAMELPIFKPKNYKFTLDGEHFNSAAMLIAVANGSSYGGGMQVCPRASINDGFFDVMILAPISKIEFLKVFPKVFSGKHISHPAVTIRRCREITISADAIAYADGERIGMLPVTAKVVSNALLTWHRNF